MGTPATESSRALYFYTGIGLLLGFGLFATPLSLGVSHFYAALDLPWITVVGLNDATLKTASVLGILTVVLYGERRPLSSIGIKRPHLSDLALGVGAFAIGEAAMYLTETLLPHRFAAGSVGRVALFARLPLWLMLLGSVVNGIFEELTARGFAIERLSEVTHSTVAGAVIALALNLGAHLPYWGWRQTTILAPGLATFVALYLWRRSVVPCAIGHILNDAFPRALVLFHLAIPLYLMPYVSYDWQGSIYYTKGDFDRSIQSFSRAISRNPHDSYAYDWRGLAWLNKKDYAKAFSDFAEAMRVDPTSAAAYGDRAFAYQNRHDNQHAIADLDHAIALEPDQANWYEMRARLEAENQEWARAAEDYSHAIRLDPFNEDLFNRRAYVEYLDRQYELAIRDYYAVIRFRPKDSDAWTNLAIAYEENKNYREALSALSNALEADPKSSYAYHERTHVHEAQNNYDFALEDVNEAIAVDPRNPDLYESRAYIRIQRSKDTAGALSDYAKMIALDPKRSQTYVQRAWIYAVQKNNTAAIADYDSAIALKQDDSSLYAQRGEMFYRSRDYAKALADWKKALELKQDEHATYNSLAWLLATSPDIKTRDGKKAIEYALKSCELSEWKVGEAIDTLAAAYAEAGDFKRAVEFEKKAIALMKPGVDATDEARARLELYQHRHPYREIPS
jgi:tetratricopeptide (TPR) repeat protein